MRAPQLGSVLLALALCAPRPSGLQDDPRPWRSAAREAALWLERIAEPTEAGVRWPADPAQPDSYATNLYSGSAGVLVFLVELAQVDDDPRWRDLALAGARQLVSELPNGPRGSFPLGLYTGLAGQSFALASAGLAFDDDQLLQGARAAQGLLESCADPSEHGVSWGPVNDVIGGAAGIGFHLLWAHETFGYETALELAQGTAAHLIAVAEERESGLSWPMSAGAERDLPNFSHGTAGVSAFLAQYSLVANDERAQRAAEQGALHLLALAEEREGALSIHHHTPGGEALHYLGWCHGPPGTARLFGLLQRARPDERWQRAEVALTNTLLWSGLPEARPDGYWNNVGICCGAAGVGAFLLDRGGEEAEQLALALGRDLLARAERVQGGLRWVQAEHRVRPELLQAQTGYMQGAAGVGLFLLRLDGQQVGRPPALRLPDDPFRRP